ncbi:spore germination protein GerW family protein [Mangrovivirga sp. M17]|uniref:Spore germination protein GerW family protein n=1 Tax=Mangrovivirga halotolerans TaxID=2993936 RepID=A0ABT3RUM3_9BACT|nr:spore germination protein GerW family protein [Mangrovivirga halotolerans]MCX2745481.1 spore germination protein GerW family protein [Mangrovivirga halotolerans]
MEVNFDQLLNKITDFIKDEANTETIIGKPFELGEFTCVSVVRIGMGFGSGGGSGDSNKAGKGEGGGAGVGLGIDPIGFLVTRDKEISFLPATKGSKGMSAAFEKIPDMVNKILDKKEKAKN